ncbi:uncharacterized protein LOC124777805 [Schistocerca piceifrons]|uniref:uncharacterized protein LOC124777805 n=1 Tax=Schistocerca piceifrons TaxID=274613 RepID=UPI001F5EC9BE|nr:uncharacterized protein LOC124777805 [Schistocerca piceifrons]XP_047109277.1 uncharacterized protein LOC124777805 [Schistocerca piceifrons]
MPLRGIVNMAAAKSNSEERSCAIFGCWNVGGAFMERRKDIVTEKMWRTGLHYLGVTETKMKDENGSHWKEIGRDCDLLFKGVTYGRARAGVGLILRGEYKNNVKDWKGVNERLLVSHIVERGHSIALFVFYGPDNCRLKVDKMVFFNELQNTIDQTKEDNIIIVGDFNARVGREAEKWDNVIGKEGENVMTDSGELLLQLCVGNDLVILNTFFEHEGGQKYTRYCELKNAGGEGTKIQQSMIDYCIVKRSMLPLVRDTRAHDDAIIKDHRLVTMEMEMEQKPTKDGVNRCRQHNEIDTQIRYHLLRQQAIQTSYQNHVSDILSRNPQQSAASLEDRWSSLRNVLLEAAENVCGSSRPCCNRRGTAWWTDDVAGAVQRKKVAWRNYRIERDHVHMSDYKNERTTAKKAVEKAKRFSWTDFGNKLGSPRTEDQKLFFHVLKKVNRDAHCTKQNLKSTDGSLLTDMNEIVGKWRGYFEERFALSEDPGLQKPENEVGEIISRNEMKNSLQKIKNGRSAGHDRITPEMVKHMGEKGHVELLRVFNMAWKDKKVPDDWKETIVFPFYRDGDRSLCESYGAISFLNTAAKVYARILEERIRKGTEEKLNEAQCGYRRNRSKNDHAFVIRQLIELSNVRRTALHLCHINLERALGKVALSVVLETLGRKHVPASTTLAVLSLFEGRINYVRTGNVLSRAFGTGFSLRPQDSLSSYISILVLDDVFNSYQARTKESICKYMPVSVSAYCDQVVLLAATRTELQHKLDVWCEETNGKRLHLLAEDARVMSVLAGEDVGTVEIDGRAILEVPCLSYSGLCIGPRLTAEEFNRCIGDAGRLFNAAKHGIVGNHRVVGKRTKEALFDSEYVERMVRGSATRWISAKSDIPRMKSMEDRYLRHSTNSGCRRYNMRTRADTRSLAGMRQQQLAYSDHVRNMEEGRAPRSVLETLESAKKTPVYSWRRDVKKARDKTTLTLRDPL